MSSSELVIDRVTPLHTRLHCASRDAKRLIEQGIDSIPMAESGADPEMGDEHTGILSGVPYTTWALYLYAVLL